MDLTQFKPKPQLVVRQTIPTKPKFPVIDAHNHLGVFGGNAVETLTVHELCNRLDEAGVTHYVDLDGGWGEDIVQQHLDYLSPTQTASRCLAEWTGLAGLNWVMHFPNSPPTAWKFKRDGVQAV